MDLDKDYYEKVWRERRDLEERPQDVVKPVKGDFMRGWDAVDDFRQRQRDVIEREGMIAYTWARIRSVL